MITNDVTTYVKIAEATDRITFLNATDSLKVVGATDQISIADAVTNLKFIWVETLYIITAHKYFDIPVGLINGVNRVFTLGVALVTSTAEVIINGLQLKSTEYTIVGLTLTLDIAPESGDLLWAHYTRE